ncbi:alpha/beta hydrolase, partial [Novipirellula maiorica]
MRLSLPKPTFINACPKRLLNPAIKYLLVFIHGYNVGFEAAVQRTAQ